MISAVPRKSTGSKAHARMPRALAVRAHASSAAPDLEPDSIVTRDGAYIEPEERIAMIAEAAYYRAEKRGFDPGHEVVDWLAAEAAIDAALQRGDMPAPRDK